MSYNRNDREENKIQLNLAKNNLFCDVEICLRLHFGFISADICTISSVALLTTGKSKKQKQKLKYFLK